MSDQGATEFAAEPLEPAEAAHVERNSALSATPARLLRLDQGLYAVEIGETTAPDGEISGLMLPVILISAPPGGRSESVEIISTSNGGVSWLAQDGGTVIVRSPSGGGHLLVASYGPPGQVPDLPRVEVRRLDRYRPHDPALGSMDFCRERGEVQTEIVLHVERLGDRRFQSSGWIGNRDQKLVTDHVTKTVIDDFKAIQIQKKNTVSIITATFRTADRSSQ